MVEHVGTLVQNWFSSKTKSKPLHPGCKPLDALKGNWNLKPWFSASNIWVRVLCSLKPIQLVNIETRTGGLWGEQQHSHLKKKHQFSIFFLPQIPTSLATNKFYVQYSGSPPSASFRYISAERPVVNRYKQTCPESSKHPPLLHFARDLDMMMIWIFRVHSSLWSFFVQITVANYQPILKIEGFSNITSGYQ